VVAGATGVQVLGELASHARPGPTILMSGAGERVLTAAARAASEQGLPVLGTLAKPFAPSALRKLLGQGVSPLEIGSRHLERTSHARLLPADLGAAIEHGEVGAHYQPKVRCRGGALAGFEALARWTHPEYGNVPPALFIPLAESSGQIDRLTAHVACTALAWFGELQRDMGRATAPRSQAGAWVNVQLALNLSPLCLPNLDILRSGARIDLLFTDVVMPGPMAGKQLADEAVRMQPDLKVLFTSGYTGDAIVHHGRLDPGVQLLSKPYRRAEMLRKIRRVLDEK
jgi:CheY-like chemotaxis protein